MSQMDLKKKNIILKKKIKVLKEQLHDEKIKNFDTRDKFLSESQASVILIKYDLQQLVITIVNSCPNKKTMIQQLQNDGKWTAQCCDPSYNIRKDAKIHFIQWLYMLTYSNDYYFIYINQALIKRQVSPITFSAFVARIYSCMTIDPMYFIMRYIYIRPFELVYQMEGLRLYGLSDKRFMECLVVLKDVKKSLLKSYPGSTSLEITPVSSSTIQSTQVSLQDQKKKIKVFKSKGRASIIMIKHNLEQLEKIIDSESSFPKKKAMIQQLKNDGMWTVQYFDLINNIPRDGQKHFVKWFYMLTYNKFILCLQLRKFLIKRKVSLITFSAFVARIYSCETMDTLKFLFFYSVRPVKLVYQLEGLRIYGMSDERFKDCLRVYQDIRALENKFKSTLQKKNITIIKHNSTS